MAMHQLYLGGPLFDAGHRHHNLMLEAALIARGRRVILPQRRALEFKNSGGFDLVAIALDCQKCCEDRNTIFVGCLDGPDADSGTAVEYAYAMGATRRAILYRTDFRTAPEKELGLNAMFRHPGATFIYFPAFFTESEAVEQFYRELALLIHEAALAIEATEEGSD